MLSFALRVYSKFPCSNVLHTAKDYCSPNFIKNGMTINSNLITRNYLAMSSPKKSPNKMAKRSSVGSLLAGCCFSLCKKQKTDDAADSPTEQTSLLGAFSSKKSLNNLEIGVDDLSKSIDQSGNFPSLSGGVLVSTTDKLERRPAKLRSVKADIAPIIEKPELELSEETLQSAKGAGAVQKKKNLPPNYFVALQFTNQQIKEGLKNVQDHIIRGETKLLPALVTLKKLHITLLVFHAGDNEELEKAKEALENCTIKARDLMEKPLSLEISGVSTFNNRVVFAGIKENEQKAKLLNLAEICFSTFEEKGFEVREGKAFNPHLTLFKLSQAPSLAKKGIRKIEPHLYQEYAHKTFGTERVQSIQLLSMVGEKDDKGYYQCLSELQFCI